MDRRLSFHELVKIEKAHHVWEHKLFGYPIWIHCREPLYNGMMAERKITYPGVGRMLKSMVDTIKFLITQNRYKHIYFLMERVELLEIYRQDPVSEKILFLNHEQEPVCEGSYIESDFFNLLRFLSRKVSFLIFRKKYRSMIQALQKTGYQKEIEPYIRTAFGDALFLKILSILLHKSPQKFYSGAVIPIGEKFLNVLNSYEVQHGVIYPEHIGYIGIPEVKNRLLLYSDRYQKILKDAGYTGKLIVHEFKKHFLEKGSDRYFPIVIYTQPTLKMQEEINAFFQKYRPDNLYIQRHPKDYFDYDIDSVYFVTATTPREVGYPIIYTSSIVENFTLYHRTCYIYNVKHIEFDIEAFLRIYTEGTRSKMVIRESLEELYLLIGKEISSHK